MTLHRNYHLPETDLVIASVTINIIEAKTSLSLTAIVSYHIYIATTYP